MRALLGVLGCVGVATEEVEAFGQRLGDERRRGQAWLLLHPTGALRGMSMELYRNHVRELLGRVERGQDTRLGTAAECLAALSTVSLEVMPKAEARAAIELAWEKVFGSPARGDPFREEWSGQAEETLAKARKKLAAPDRVMGPKTESERPRTGGRKEPE